MTPLTPESLARSTFCFGTMTFGREADEDASRALFDRCRDAGITCFDCADIYAGGDSERILGKFIQEHRDELIVTTKVGMHEGLAPDTIRKSIDASLERLNTDYVDIYFCHRFDDEVPMADTLGAMNELIDAGKVRALGVSNWTAWQMARGLGYAEQNGWHRLLVMQPMYNITKRTAEIEMFPLAQAEKLAVLNYNPLGGGLLTGKYFAKEVDASGRLQRQDNYARRYGTEQVRETARRFVDFAREHHYDPVTLAIAWTMKHPAVTAPILGARSVEQLEPALAAADFDLSDDLYVELCALTPPVPPATDRNESE